MTIKVRNGRKKIRVNITVDKDVLEKAKKKLGLFGGKVSSLFNSYLNDFVSSIDKDLKESNKELENKIKEMEERLKRLEKESKD